MRVLTWLGLTAGILALSFAGVIIWLDHSVSPALAPEPARLTNDLVGSTGATTASVYHYSNEPTRVLKWPGSYVSSANPPAVGTPCSTTDLANGQITYKVIQGAGNYRRCY